MDAGSLLWFLIIVAIFGLIVGAVGRLLVPGPTPMGLLGTMGAGIAGAFIGGFVGRLLLGPSLTSGWMWVLSFLGAALVVALVSRRGRRYGDGYADHGGYDHGGFGRGVLAWGRPRRAYGSSGYDAPMVVHEVDRPHRSGWRRRFF